MTLAVLLGACALGPDQITAQGGIDGGVGSKFENPLMNLELVADFSAVTTSDTEVSICTRREGSLFRAQEQGAYANMAVNASNTNLGKIAGENLFNAVDLIQSNIDGPTATVPDAATGFEMQRLVENLSLARTAEHVGYYLGASISLLPGCADGIQVRNRHGNFYAGPGSLVFSQMIEVSSGPRSDAPQNIALDMSPLLAQLSQVTSNAQLHTITRP